MAFLNEQLIEDIAQEWANAGIASAMASLHPGEHEPRLRQLFEDDYIEPWSEIDIKLDEVANRSVDECLAKVRETFESRLPDDIHDYLEGWFGFAGPDDRDDAWLLDEDDDVLTPPPFGNLVNGAPLGGGLPSRAVRKKDKLKAKKQRKAAKKTRKKNRKKGT